MLLTLGTVIAGVFAEILQIGRPSYHPTNNVKALKVNIQNNVKQRTRVRRDSDRNAMDKD